MKNKIKPFSHKICSLLLIILLFIHTTTINAGNGNEYLGYQQGLYIKASGFINFDRFGISVDISGNTMVVGASNREGKAYVFVRQSGIWEEQTILTASNPTQMSDNFGHSVAISGETIVVGARLEGSNANTVNGDEGNDDAPNSGAAYVFVRNGEQWTQQAYLKASNAEAGDLFGNSVAIDGDIVVVGAHIEDSNANGVNGDQSNNASIQSGAAYIFERNNQMWTQQAYLKSINNVESQFNGAHFGYSVAVSGDTVVVGAYEEDDPTPPPKVSGLNTGGVYVFTKSEENWVVEDFLQASNKRNNTNFGNAVDIEGDTIVVGSEFEDSNATGVNGDEFDISENTSGAAYVFNKGADGWMQSTYIKASNTESGDQFGKSVSISGNTIVIGSENERSNSTGVNGDETDNSLNFAGAAYVYKFDSKQWGFHSYIKASNTDLGDRFGYAVSIDGDNIIVGANGEQSNATGINGEQSNNSGTSVGAVYLFENNGVYYNGFELIGD